MTNRPVELRSSTVAMTSISAWRGSSPSNVLPYSLLTDHESAAMDLSSTDRSSMECSSTERSSSSRSAISPGLINLWPIILLSMKCGGIDTATKKKYEQRSEEYIANCKAGTELHQCTRRPRAKLSLQQSSSQINNGLPNVDPAGGDCRSLLLLG